ncbi:MAG TPA: ribonuclease HII [Clostridia bacterium]|nr:ribonuclease HII [Clostridia bacterium]
MTDKKKTGIRITQRDIDRYQTMSVLEDDLRGRGYTAIAGVDEAGRGPLAGPVVAAACILPAGVTFYGLNDSKKMTEKRREAVFEAIRKKAVSWSVAMVSHDEIDRANILIATRDAMRRALTDLPRKPDIALVDGMTLEGFDYPILAEIKGDARHNAIAAASVLAKVTRDHMMMNWDMVYPAYGFSSHKGYGTAAHIEAIKKHGPCPIHRMTFLTRIIAGPEEVDRGAHIEQIVCQDLIAKGHTILEHRFALQGIGEIDFITTHNNQLFVIECKGRSPSSNLYGGVESALREQQIARIRKVAGAWLQAQKTWAQAPVEFVYVAVDLDGGGRVDSIRYLPI